MRDWIYFITLLMVTTIVLLMISSLYGCTTFEILKEGAKVSKIITTTETIDKKIKEKEKTDEEKEKEKTDEEKEKENTIACIKLQPECNTEW